MCYEEERLEYIFMHRFSIFYFSFFCFFIAFSICSYGNYYNIHNCFFSNKCIYYSYSNPSIFNLKKSCQLCTILISQCFSIISFILWKWILTHFLIPANTCLIKLLSNFLKSFFASSQNFISHITQFPRFQQVLQVQNRLYQTLPSHF